MGLRDDLERFRDVGEEYRMDLKEYIKHGSLGEDIQVPIKMVNLPEFVYSMNQRGGLGQAGEDQDPQVGDPVEFPDENGEGDEAGEGEGDHGHYEMDPEDFAKELDDELDLDLDPKGKKVVEETVGDMVEVAQSGPRSALDVDYLYKEGLKRKMAMWHDEEYLEEVCKVQGATPDEIFEYVRQRHSMPVDRDTVEAVWEQTDSIEYTSFEDVEQELGTPDRSPPAQDITHVPIRREDERYRHPEIVEQKQKNVVVVNIRDVSGSMGPKKRDLVERVFTPLDWYLQGKYEHAEFRYIAHDTTAWEVDRDDFFGMTSGGGTQISSAYAKAQKLLDTYYPWQEWNRYVFGAGDGENFGGDTQDEMIPLMEEMDVNLHGYIETVGRGMVIEKIDKSMRRSDVAVASVNGKTDVIPAIEQILSAASAETGDQQ